MTKLARELPFTRRTAGTALQSENAVDRFMGRSTGDDTIVDTIDESSIALRDQRQNGEIAVGGRSAESMRFARRNGMCEGTRSVFQSVHYNPGDNRQSFTLRGGGGRPEFRLRNMTAPWRVAICPYASRNFGADTTWSRGLGWALYGFSVAYSKHTEPLFLATAQRMPDYASRISR